MRTCKVCKEKFEATFNSMQPTCGIPCAIELTNIKKEKARRQENHKAKKQLRESDRSWWVKEAQKEFNKYIRNRDKDKPCISCGTESPSNDPIGGLWDCGHYRSVGSCPELRFEPLNAHKQCKRCNRDMSGNVVEYRINLAARIGDKLEWLEGPHKSKKYLIADLMEIRNAYRHLNKGFE